MILARNTLCNKIEIKVPRWQPRQVGIAPWRVGDHNAIDITAADKSGKRYFPNTLYASGKFIRSCETQTLPSGVTLYLVPIDKLEPLQREPKPIPYPMMSEEEMPESIKRIFFNSGYGNLEQIELI